MSSAGDILLIEDHRDIAELVFDFLEAQGSSVDYAADGEAGQRFAIAIDRGAGEKARPETTARFSCTTLAVPDVPPACAQ